MKKKDDNVERKIKESIEDGTYAIKCITLIENLAHNAEKRRNTSK